MRADTEIPMDELRRQSEVERWRNKIRLQEKYQVRRLMTSSSSIILILSRLAISSGPSTFV